MTGALLLVLASAGVVGGAVLAARSLGLRDPLEWSIAVLLLAAVEVVVVSVAAGGLLERYEPGTLLAVTAVVGGALGAVSLRARGGAARPREVVTALRAALGTLEPWQAVVVAVAAGAVVWRLVLALALPPFAYDALTYHLTLVASWVQGGSVEPNPYAECCSHYPANAETLAGWPTLFLDHELLIETPQIVLAVLGALAVAGLARLAGARPATSLTAAALFALTPIVLAQANTAYNDVAIASTFLVGLLFAARMNDTTATASPRAYALLAGAALGFAAGTKTSGLVMAGVVGLLVAAKAALATRGGALTARRATALVAVFASAALVVGGYWYARNWVETGNPVWPFRVAPAGVEVFAGPERVDEYLSVPPGSERSWPVEVVRSWYRDLVFWTRRTYSYEQREGGLGPLWSWVGWAAVALLSLAAWRRRRDLLATVVLPVAVVFALLPYKWWSRFTIALAALGAVAVALAFERLRPGGPRRLLVAAAVLLTLAGAARATWTLDPSARGATLTMRDVAGLVRRTELDRTVGTLFYPEYRWLAGVAADATVVVETEAPSIRFVYPLFGSGLDRRVVQLLPGDEEAAAELVPRDGDVYVAVERGGAFDRWASADGSLTRIFDERGVRVYRRTAAAREAQAGEAAGAPRRYSSA